MHLLLRRALPALLTLIFCVGALALFYLLKWPEDGPKSSNGAIFLGNPWKLSSGGWVMPNTALSSDGKYVAALCPPSVKARQMPFPSPQTQEVFFGQKDLVIWRVADQKQLVRISSLDNTEMTWSRNGDTLAVGGKFWKWDKEKATLIVSPPTIKSPGLPIRTSGWINLDNKVRVVQSSNDPAKLRAFDLYRGTPLKIRSKAARIVQEMPSGGSTAAFFEGQRLDIVPTLTRQTVQIVCAREMLPLNDVPFSTSLPQSSVSAWDISNGRKLWEWRTPFGFYPPNVSCSPDGRMIAVLGTASPDAESLRASPAVRVEELRKDHLTDNGVVVLNAETGKPMCSFRAFYPNNSLNRSNVQWIEQGINNALVVSDWQWIEQKNAPWLKQRLLRVFDAQNGQETNRYDVTKQWPFTADGERATWNISADGKLWALATVADGTRIFPMSAPPSTAAPKNQ